MNFYVGRDVVTDRWCIYGRERQPGGPSFALEADANGNVTTHRIDEGGSVKPLLAFDGAFGREALKALTDALAAQGFRAGADDAPPLSAHLSDAIGTRDRLFSLVEKLTNTP